MSGWNGWYHITSGTYGTWLRGDARGWRSRHHRRHVEGDYKHPPPGERDRALRRRSQRLLKGPPVKLTKPMRKEAGRAVVEMLLFQEVELLCLSLDAVHLHLLGRFGKEPARPKVGRAKKHAYHLLQKLGHRGSVWAKRCRVEPITDREHQVNTYQYILDHAEKGAWTWSFKQGLYWTPQTPPKRA
ncbi:MAG: hypothetical protein ISS78_00995 [Phycisphaerae bacterium]|nr:hypothetical protein [Phycisphaerae bacterium]